MHCAMHIFIIYLCMHIYGMSMCAYKFMYAMYAYVLILLISKVNLNWNNCINF